MILIAEYHFLSGEIVRAIETDDSMIYLQLIGDYWVNVDQPIVESRVIAFVKGQIVSGEALEKELIHSEAKMAVEEAGLIATWRGECRRLR